MMVDKSPFRYSAKSISLTVLFSSLPVLIAAPSAFSQTAVRSNYTAGPVSYGHMAIPSQAEFPRDLSNIFEDVNGDGYTDIVVTVISTIDKPRNNGRPGAILLNNGDNTFKLATGFSEFWNWSSTMLLRFVDYNSNSLMVTI